MHINKKSKGDSRQRCGGVPRGVRFKWIKRGWGIVPSQFGPITRNEDGQRVNAQGLLRSRYWRAAR